MEAFVQMPLETYDVLKRNNEYLKGALKKERESHDEDVAQAKKEKEDFIEKRANELTVKLREVFGDKSKLKFSENPKGMIAGVGLRSLGLLSLVGGEDKHSHLKKIEDQIELKWLMKELVQRGKISFEELAKEKEKNDR